MELDQVKVDVVCIICMKNMFLMIYHYIEYSPQLRFSSTIVESGSNDCALGLSLFDMILRF